MSLRSQIKVLSYSHDSYGLGHFRRSVSIASALVEREANVTVLCWSGSPAPDLFALPPRCDIVKMPCITKAPDGGYVSKNLDLPFDEISDVRSVLLDATVRTFQPDVLLVDHTPSGPGGEVVRALRTIERERLPTRVVLGLRDIIDEPRRVRSQMADNGTADLLRNYYDEIMVYGDRRVLDVCEEYGLPDDLRAKTSYVGFACPPASEDRGRTEPRDGVQTIVVSAGGGADGCDLLQAVIAAVCGPLRSRKLAVTLVAGPLMSRRRVKALRRAAGGDSRLSVLHSTRRMLSLLAGADLVIGMGGYNSVYEALSCGRRLLVVPRARPRAEQRERSRRLGALGLLSALSSAEAAEPERMAHAIDAALERPEQAAGRTELPFDGATRAAERLLAAISTSSAHARSPLPPRDHNGPCA